MKPAIALREKLRGSQPVLGVLVAHQLSLELLESCMIAGLDFAIIDAEHFDHGGRLMADAFAFGRVAGFPTLMRPPSIEPTTLRLAMDLGPCGLLLPMIDRPEQLDAVCDSIYMPPRGQRRPGGLGNRWVSKFNYDSFRGEVEDALVVIPQIESPIGLENVSAIAAHPLTTAVGVGPYDLSARLGICGEMNHPTLVAAQRRILDAAAAADKTAMSVGDGGTLISRGYRFMCVAEPFLYLQSALKQLVQSLRGGA